MNNITFNGTSINADKRFAVLDSDELQTLETKDNVKARFKNKYLIANSMGVIERGTLRKWKDKKILFKKLEVDKGDFYFDGVHWEGMVLKGDGPETKKLKEEKKKFEVYVEFCSAGDLALNIDKLWSKCPRLSFFSFGVMTDEKTITFETFGSSKEEVEKLWKQHLFDRVVKVEQG